MKLYDFRHAPNPRKLRTYLAEKGIAMEQVKVNIVKGEARTPGFLARNPMAALPVLELDDGSHLTESLAIIEYLEELYPEPPMFGRTPLERARTREAERFIETAIFNPIVRIALHESPAFAGREQIAAVAAGERAALQLPLRLLGERLAAGGPFVCGERVSLADCTLWAAFAFAGFTQIDVTAPPPAVADWLAMFGERPSATA